MGTSKPQYTIEFHFHRLSCWCMASSVGLDLVSLERIYHKLNHGICTPTRCKLPNMELECILSEYKQQSTLRPEIYQLESVWLIFPCREWFRLGINGFLGGLLVQLIFWRRLEFRSRRFEELLEEAIMRYQLPYMYFYRIESNHWAFQWTQ